MSLYKKIAGYIIANHRQNEAGEWVIDIDGYEYDYESGKKIVEMHCILGLEPAAKIKPALISALALKVKELEDKLEKLDKTLKPKNEH